jgi:hypothetical protein
LLQGDEPDPRKRVGPEVALVQAKLPDGNAEKRREKINREGNPEHLGEEADEEGGIEACASPLASTPWLRETPEKKQEEAGRD